MSTECPATAQAGAFEAALEEYFDLFAALCDRLAEFEETRVFSSGELAGLRAELKRLFGSGRAPAVAKLAADIVPSAWETTTTLLADQMIGAGVGPDYRP